MSERWLKRLMPYPSRFIQIGGHNMHYLDEGQGPVVLLCHGNPTWCFFFRQLIAVLKPHFRVIAPDALGLGLSDHPVGLRFRATDRISHLEELLDKLGVERFSLVMHDWGGAIGTGLATRRTHLVDRMVYLNTTLTETESLPFIIKAAANRYTGKLLTKYTRQFLRFTTNQGVVHSLPRDVKRGYHYPYKTIARRSAIWDFVDDIPFDNSHPTYSAMLELAEDIPNLANIPVKIVWGLRDPCFHREMLTKVAQHFPHASILEIPDASHLILEDAPDVANSAIASFLLGADHAEQPVSLDAPLGSDVNNLVRRFWQEAVASPDREAVVEPIFIGDTVKYGQVRYRDCFALLNKYQRGLMKMGLVAGDRVIMFVSPGLEFLLLSYAVMARGATPVFLDPGMGKERLLRAIEELKADVFIGSPRAFLLKLLKRRLFKSFKFAVVASEWGLPGAVSLSYLKKFAARSMQPVAQKNEALLAFTSGATGKPKAVEFTNEMLADQLKVFEEQFGLVAGGRDLPLLPLFALYNFALGICSVFPGVNQIKPLSLDPKRIVKIIKDQQVSTSFGSPTLWRKIAEYCVRSRTQLHEIKSVFIAGAPVSDDVLLQVTNVLPNGEAYTPYGATEALPVTLVSAQYLKQVVSEPALSGEQGTLVGKAIDGVTVRVVHTFEGVRGYEELVDCKPLEIGEIIVSGSTVSERYFQGAEATFTSKIIDGDGRCWHRMGDMGYLSNNEDLYFCGRKVHSIIHNGSRHYSVPIEFVFNQHRKVRRSALVYLESEHQPAVVVEPYPQFFPRSEAELAEFEKELLQLAKTSAISEGIVRFFFHESFPVDGRHNAKIFRDQLGEWADRQPRYQRAA